MDLQDGHIKFDGLLKTTDGRKFFGTIHVNNVLRTQNDIADYLLQVTTKCFIEPGDAIIYEGVKHMLGRGVDEFSRGAVLRMFRMIEVNAELAWSRIGTSTDSLTGLGNAAAPTSLGTALVNLLATRRISDAFHSNDSKFEVVSNSLLLPDDRIGPHKITFSEVRHGLTYAEAM